ncbi:MAG: uridine kinase [Bacteroidales bacterium]|nr:uridine kinase [Bacteroidales bacterium]
MLIIGIAGGTGSGKSTVVKKILELLPEDEVAIIPQDSYYRDNKGLSAEVKKELNFDHPDSIEWDLLVKQIMDLKEDKAVQQPIYSYITCERDEQTVPVTPKNVLIVEGIMVLTYPPLRDLMTVKVFVDAEADDRLSRVLMRDTVERGRDAFTVLDRYQKTVKPMHLQFIEPSKRYADLIVPQGGNNRVAIEMLASIIHRHLEQKAVR